MSPMLSKRIRELLYCWLCCWGYLSPQPLQALDSSPLRIASFNVQVFGQTKISNPTTLDILTRIFSRYDIVFMQEIRDSENTAVYELLHQIQMHNQNERDYQVAVSDRLGRTASKEQYAFFYDARRVQLEEHFVYDDVGDKFEREPFVGKFHAGNRDFTLMGIHVTPRGVISELRSLGQVYSDVKRRQGSQDIILMGDFNADCGYYDAKQGFQYFEDQATLILPDGIDTTVAEGKCSYDRVLGFGATPRWIESSGVFRFADAYQLTGDVSKLVSDHFPVEFSVNIGGSGTAPAAKMPETASRAPSVPSAPSASRAPSGTPTPEAPPVPVPAPTPAPEVPAGDLGQKPTSSTSVAQCGQNNYVTTKGYCYGYFDSGRRRVANSCCPSPAAPSLASSL